MIVIARKKNKRIINQGNKLWMLLYAIKMKIKGYSIEFLKDGEING